MRDQPSDNPLPQNKRPADQLKLVLVAISYPQGSIDLRTGYAVGTLQYLLSTLKMQSVSSAFPANQEGIDMFYSCGSDGLYRTPSCGWSLHRRWVRLSYTIPETKAARNKHSTAAIIGSGKEHQIWIVSFLIEALIPHRSMSSILSQAHHQMQLLLTNTIAVDYFVLMHTQNSTASPQTAP